MTVIHVVFGTTEYNKILEQPGDSFYVRTLFERRSGGDGELSFVRDRILYVDSTLYKGKLGVWRAWLVDDEGNKLQCGTVPSKARWAPCSYLTKRLNVNLNLPACKSSTLS